jgi:putative peptidoglycan lipid II flippase
MSGTAGAGAPSAGAHERGQMARRAGTVAAGTLASRVLGAVRDSVIAASFPVAATDAFFVAFTIPNALRSLLGEGAVGSAFVPVYAEVRAASGDARARAFYAGLSGVMIAILAGVTALGVVFAAPVVTAYAAGYRAQDPEKFDLTIALTRIVFPYIFFMGLAALGMGVLNAHRRFFVPAFAPALLNVAQIAAPFVLVAPAVALGLDPVASLALGALAGGVLQVLAQFPALRAEGLLQRPRWGLGDPYVRKALRLLGPLLVGLGIYQLNLILSRQFASFLPEGSQSYLYYGSRVVDIPQGVFALAVASAAIPSLADLRSRGEHLEVKRTFTYALRLSLFVALPATVLLVLLAEPTAAVLFGRGDFDHRHVVETGRSLAWQAAGVWAVSAVRIVVPMFYAYNDTRTPVFCSAVNLVVFVGVALALMGPLAHVGLAVAITAANVAQLGALLVLLRRRSGLLGLRAVAASVARTSLACAAMAAVAAPIASLGRWERGGNDLVNVAALAGALVAAGAVFAGAAKLLRAPELSDVVGALARRVRPRAA